MSPPGKRHLRGLVDMSVTTESKYEPPRREDCDEDVWNAQIDGGTLQVATRVHHKQIVHFSISIWVDGVEASRLDTSDGELHRHTFWMTKPEERKILETIPVESGRYFVNSRYSESYEQMLNSVSDEVRRWRSQ